jgi:glycogen(starch) synthase
MAAKARTTKSRPKRKTTASARRREPLLIEAAFEVCNQLGGIYTVMRTKVPAMVERWGSRYCMIGPYHPDTASVEFEEHTPTGAFGEAVKRMREWGFDVKFGTWLVTGRPRLILLNVQSAYDRLPDIKYKLWEHHHIETPTNDDLMHQVLAFGFLVEQFAHALCEREGGRRKIVMHLHEWMGASAIPEIRRSGAPVGLVFTTHATMLGRYLAMNDPWFHDHVAFVDWEKDAKRFNVEAQVRIERAAAHGSHVFTTVSEVTAEECKHLLGRECDVVLPNGLNIERFVALHEFQVLHREYKERIGRFVMGHFCSSYPIDLDKTLYFFTSGRYEYRNKGFDLTLEALARLNWRLRENDIDRTIVFFLITKRPYRSINPEVLRSRAVMEELRDTCEHIQEQFGQRLFESTAMGKTPKFEDMVDEYWMLRLRRTVASWRSAGLPIVVTHDLVDDATDEVLKQVRAVNLYNRPEDKVKVVYHPDFIGPGNPLFGMEYDQFVRGCHMGIFPSYYEPWGYTPLECVARGIPAITSDLSGFGAFVTKYMPEHQDHGMFVTQRRDRSFDESANQIADWLYDFTVKDRRERITMRNRTESVAERFDWRNLGAHYDRAHQQAMDALPL